MQIFQFPTQIPMTVGVYPNIKLALFGDNLDVVTSPGYLNNSSLDSASSLSNADIISAFYNFNQQSQIGIYGTFSVNISSSSGIITLSLIPIILPKSDGTEASRLLSTNGTAGIITTSALNIPPMSTYIIDWTNPSITPTSVFSFCLQGGTAMPFSIDFLCPPSSGSAELAICNGSGSTVVGDFIIGYTIF